MQNEIYIFFLYITLCGLKNVNAFIGHNIRNVEENEVPAVVCILRYDPDASWTDKMQCTGTLIGPNFIITAAHCVGNPVHEQFEVTVGSHLVEQGQRYYPVWWITFDQWSRMHNSNHMPGIIADDIQLVKIFGIWRDVPPMPLAQINPPKLLYGLDLAMIGCGKTDSGIYPPFLQVATVKAIDLKTCSNMLSHENNGHIQLDDRYTCTVGEPYAYMHDGDEGGPLLYFGVLVGVNIATCPLSDSESSSPRVNIHVNLYRYLNFFNEFILNDH